MSHKEKCQWRTPPGVPVYYDANGEELNDKSQGYDEDTHIQSVSVYQVDGLLEKLYC